ncbi:MAG: DNA primase [Candidatus Cloacimonetes bacterium HGW-Cloacimonetes-3]|jgi:DNA primase|nr:MAG: DNA primase [Candidatus Cloacimonetes bacterium HGW-Cloacimonetes-3]
MEPSLIDQIRQASDIVDVVQSYLPLKHVGTNWRGICPFHNDTKPSLYVSQPKQIYKCFACGKAGNVIGFVADYEKLSFIEAVKKLAMRAGIAIPDQERTKTVSTKREQLLHVYKSAAEFFAANLFAHGQHVLEYLQKRSFSAETAKELQLGYALNSEKALLNHLLKEGLGVSLLKDSGLFGNYSGGLSDLFRDRLIFPIHNSFGDVIAFGGRLLEEKPGVGKYFNSPGTELYTKGKELYGLFKTKYNLSKAGNALVCEGYFDFLRLYESGFNNAVASLGTALTEDQISLLSRFGNKATMLYDGDAAGIKAAVRGGLLCLARGMDIRVAILPLGEDPDSLILKQGKPALQGLIDSAPGLISFLATDTRFESPTAERIELILDALRNLRDQIKRELLVKEVSEAFGISEAALHSKLHRSSPIQPVQSIQTPTANTQGESFEERHVLILALKDYDSYKLLASELNTSYFSNRLYRELFSYLVSLSLSAGTWEPAALLDNIENKEIKESLADLLFEDLQQMRFEDCLTGLRIRKIQRDLDEMDRDIIKDPNNLELLKQKEKLTLVYRRMTRKVVNKVLF